VSILSPGEPDHVSHLPCFSRYEVDPHDSDRLGATLRSNVGAGCKDMWKARGGVGFIATHIEIFCTNLVMR
jgi:hypothetical protein